MRSCMHDRPPISMGRAPVATAAATLHIFGAIAHNTCSRRANQCIMSMPVVWRRIHSTSHDVSPMVQIIMGNLQSGYEENFSFGLQRARRCHPDTYLRRNDNQTRYKYTHPNNNVKSFYINQLINSWNFSGHGVWIQPTVQILVYITTQYNFGFGRGFYTQIGLDSSGNISNTLWADYKRDGME